MPSPDADLVVIGAGILGLATARALLIARPDLDVVIVEKEPRIAEHQSAHNSGVIHSGIYYKPGSHKATMVFTGREALIQYANERGIAHDICGKIIVATRTEELPGLEKLRHLGEANGVPAKWLDARAIADFEPHCDGIAGLHVPSTGIIDFPAVCEAMAADVVESGGEIHLGQPVTAIDESHDSVEISTGGSTIRARAAINCGGLQSDQIAALSGQESDSVRIMPFRGEFYDLRPEARHLVRNLIYPVPDPSFPFLGVHLTRMTTGAIHAGPNAVAALAREGYSWSDVDREELADIFGRPGTRVLARKYWRTGGGEVLRSLSKRLFLRGVQRLIPDVRSGDLEKSSAGVRAQAIRSDGTLLDDFEFMDSGRVVNVVNAPSPAATASLEIGNTVAQRALGRLA